MEFADLQPHLVAVVVISVDKAGPVVVVHARTHLEKAAPGTVCGSASSWIHSRYSPWF